MKTRTVIVNWKCSENRSELVLSMLSLEIQYMSHLLATRLSAEVLPLVLLLLLCLLHILESLQFLGLSLLGPFALLGLLLLARGAGTRAWKHQRVRLQSNDYSQNYAFRFSEILYCILFSLHLIIDLFFITCVSHL